MARYLKKYDRYCVTVAEEMDAKDEELRETIKKLWPIQGKAMALILIPPREGSNIAAAADVNSVEITCLTLSCCHCLLLNYKL